MFDVIVIGGRPAGSTLAARLGKYGYTVLLLERATLPSLPAASSPIIYAATMKLLDEIGADESAYARNTPKIRQMSIDSAGLKADLDLPDDGGRDYAYAIDRARFDAALWDTAASYPTVTALQNFHATDLIRDGETVIGVTGKDESGATRQFTGRVVVGADGRFSMVARKADAQTRDENSDFPSSLLYAYWQGVAPYHGQPSSVAYEGQPGLGYLIMDSADNTAAVTIEGRADLLKAPAGDVEAFYVGLLQQQPALWERVQHAQQVTSVRGMRNVGNLYRQPGGAGWALVGDAYHQKDPLDGQGIFDAVFTAKALAWALRYYLRGEMTWPEALDWYDETARIKTYGMYKSVLNRVKSSLYPMMALPDNVQETMGRWLMEDDLIRRMFGGMMTRQIPADVMRVMTPPLLLRAAVRGGVRDGLRDVRQRVRRRTRLF